VSASQPLTGDELAAWDVEALRARDWGIVHDHPERIVALVAEVERLRAQVERAVTAGEGLAEALSESQREVALLKADYEYVRGLAERATAALERVVQ
jgi:hypothetical protein